MDKPLGFYVRRGLGLELGSTVLVKKIIQILKTL